MTKKGLFITKHFLSKKCFLGDTDEFYDAPREFHILGSCLFHRGLLVSTHLSKTDTVDILLWLKANRNILAVSSKHPVRRIVAWKEIYPSKQIHNDTTMNTMTKTRENNDNKCETIDIMHNNDKIMKKQ